MRLLLDANVLLLWIVGSLNSALVGNHRRLSSFDSDDFALVEGLAAQISHHISTPHVLTEVSNHLGSGPQQMVRDGTAALDAYIANLDEILISAKIVAANPEFHALGLTDATILHFSGADIRVVSTDFHLCNRLAAKGVDVINPRNFRTPGYAPA